MKIKLILCLTIIMMTVPAVSHSFAILKYAGDLIVNQLGLDRGPIVKVPFRSPFPPYTPVPVYPYDRHPYASKVFIQAEGW